MQDSKQILQLLLQTKIKKSVRWRMRIKSIYPNVIPQVKFGCLSQQNESSVSLPDMQYAQGSQLASSEDRVFPSVVLILSVQQILGNDRLSNC